MKKFLCYNNEDICTIYKVKDPSLWQMVNQSKKMIVYTACLRSTIRSMTIANVLWLSSNTHSCLSEDGSSGTHLFVKNILKNIYHV